MLEHTDFFDVMCEPGFTHLVRENERANDIVEERASESSSCANDHARAVGCAVRRRTKAMLKSKDFTAKFSANQRYAFVVQFLHQLNGIDVELRIGCEGFNFAELGTLTRATG